MKITVKQLKQLIKEQVNEGFFEEGDEEAVQIAQGKLANAIAGFDKVLKVASSLDADEDEIESFKDIVQQLNYLYKRVARNMKTTSSRFLK